MNTVTFSTSKTINLYDGSYQISSKIVNQEVSHDLITEILFTNQNYRAADYWVEVIFNNTITRFSLINNQLFVNQI